MAKRNKEQQQSNRYSLLDCEVRPVTKADKWCQRKMHKGKELIGEAPFGYIVTIPYLPNQNTWLDNINGRIVRCKKHCGKLLLQIIENSSVPEYGVKSFTRYEPNVSRKKRKKKKLYRILNIRNMNKSASKW